MSGTERNQQLQSIYDHPNQSLGFLLWQVSSMWQAMQRNALADIGLSHIQFVLLAGTWWLSQNGQVLTQSHLSRHVKVDVMMTSEVIRKLESQGFVQRKPHPSDTRAKALSLTESGLEVLKKAINIVETIDETFFVAVKDQKKELIGILQQLANEE